jgi:predicted MPP superfamily phosphohydrolase
MPNPTEDKKKYIWYTDTHFSRTSIWTFYKLIRHIIIENPDGLFLTGDISNGLFIKLHLTILAKYIRCPIYFVLGNHDVHFSSFKKVYSKIRNICAKYPNLIWLTSQSEPIKIGDEVALIGAEGWYDSRIGNPEYLKATFDWILIKEFRELATMEERISLFKKLADEDTASLERKLIQALDGDYKTVYILSHFPGWKEATRDVGTLLEKFWLPYNVNVGLGQMIERVMETRRRRNVNILSGHTHQPEFIRVSRNINCQIGVSKLFNLNSQKIYL